MCFVAIFIFLFVIKYISFLMASYLFENCFPFVTCNERYYFFPLIRERGGRMAVGASSLCYWDVFMLLKCELILLKYHINTNIYKNGFLPSTVCLERILKYSYIVSIIIYVCQFYNPFVLIFHFTSIISHLNH